MIDATHDRTPADQARLVFGWLPPSDRRFAAIARALPDDNCSKCHWFKPPSKHEGPLCRVMWEPTSPGAICNAWTHTERATP